MQHVQVFSITVYRKNAQNLRSTILAKWKCDIRNRG